MKIMTDWQKEAVEQSTKRRAMLDEIIAESGLMNELSTARAPQHRFTVAVDKNDKARFEDEATKRGFNSLSEMVRSAISRALQDPDFKHYSQY